MPTSTPIRDELIRRFREQARDEGNERLANASDAEILKLLRETYAKTFAKWLGTVH